MDGSADNGAMVDRAGRIRPGVGAALVAVFGELDATVAGDLRTALGALIDEGHAVVTIDGAGMTFLDSSGLGAIVGAARRLGELGGELHLRSLSASARRVLLITGVDRIVRIEAAASPDAPAERVSRGEDATA